MNLIKSPKTWSGPVTAPTPMSWGLSLSELTGILFHWWVDKCFNIFKIRIFNVHCKLTRWTPLTIQLHPDGSTEHDWLFTVYASSIKPSLPYLGPPWPPSFLFSLAPALQSSNSPFLSLQTPRGNPSLASHCCRKLYHVCKIEMHVYLRFRSFNLTIRYNIWPHVRRQTYTRVLQCSHTSVGLAQPALSHFRWSPPWPVPPDSKCNPSDKHSLQSIKLC